MTDTKLMQLLAASAAAYQRMTPEEKAEMHEAQRKSFARAEAGFGSDADELEYNRALAVGDQKTLARLNREAAQRVQALEELPPCKHCETTSEECLWWEAHDGDEAPCGAQQDE